VARLVVQGWRLAPAWLIILYQASGEKDFRSCKAGTTYEEAAKRRDELLRSGPFVKAWLIEKNEGDDR
jgi:hypothetical protein